MIDIHTHVLPFVDDGSKSIEESVNLLKEAKQCGVTKIIATPHFKSNFTASIQEITNSYNLLMPYAQELGIQLYLGQEIKHYGKDLKKVIEKEHLTLNNTKVVLLEFDMLREEDISEVVYSYVKKGFIPVIAHIERYPYCLDFSVIEEIKNCGGLIQINASSVVGKLGRYIKKFVLKLIKFGLVDFVASDIHSFRENDMLKAYNLVKKKFKQQVADDIFNNYQEYFIFSEKFN